MPFTKKKPVKKTEEKPEKPPRGYEYRTFLVKKEKSVAKEDRTKDISRVRKERLFDKER